MKHIFAAFMAAFFCLQVNATQLKADFSLGSMIGDERQPERGQIPFWAEAYLQTDLLNDWIVDLNAIMGGGHRSNADLNGNETDYEYGLLGVEGSLNQLYGRIELNHAISGDLKKENILSLELGLKERAFRFVGFYETGTGLNVHGLKAGFTF